MSDPKRRNLGRGLAALLGDEDEAPAESDATPAAETRLPVAAIRPNPFQPRRAFDEAALESLADSLRTNGLLQPILVRPAEDGEGYEIIAGERRWRAAQRAQLHEVPAIVRALPDHAALEIAIVENVQRRDLTPLEEAEGYKRLLDEFQHTQEDLARAVAKSRSHIANMLRLLQLPAPVQEMVQAGEISAGHARALLTAGDVEALARQVAAEGLSVRETERLAQTARESGQAAPRSTARGKGAPAAAPAKDADTRYLEDDLSAALGLRVSINAKGTGGKLTIEYGSLDQLDAVVARLRESL